MTKPQFNENTEDLNEQALFSLARTIGLSQNQFSLVLLRCNYVSLQHEVTRKLKELTSIPIRELYLKSSDTTLYTAILNDLGQEVPKALMVFGLETVKAVEILLVSTNQVREEFRDNFPFPVLIWINDDLLKDFIRLAPDFESWSTSIQFCLPSADIIHLLQDYINHLFADILNVGSENFLSSQVTALNTGYPQSSEVRFAINDLKNFYGESNSINPELQANLDFLLARYAHSKGEIESARRSYEFSLNFWQIQLENSKASSSSPDKHSLRKRVAVILIHLGILWRSYAVLQPPIYLHAYQQSYEYFHRSLALFTEENRQDLVARFILAKAETLQKLQQWDELEEVGKQGLALHNLYKDPIRQSRDYGFLAEVALARSNWNKAKFYAEEAVKTIMDIEASLLEVEFSSNITLKRELEVAKQYHQKWYLVLLSRAEANSGLIQEAIAHLEAAKIGLKHDNDPQLSITIFGTLRELYFSQGQYLESSRNNKNKHAIEQLYGFRAFTGASQLHAQQHIYYLQEQANVVDVASEIRISRQKNLKELFEKITHPADKLTVIHAPSGAGKSSLIYAGLIPLLKGKIIRTRYTIPIALNIYSEWFRNLERELKIALREIGFSESRFDAEIQEVDTEIIIEKVLNILRENKERQLLVFLIFDQFEEFFFTHETFQKRCSFYSFLCDCLEIPFVKIVLSIREDYLHYLLEMERFSNQRNANINLNILDRDKRYSLNNLSPKDAKDVIFCLTARSQYYLENELIDELIQDLTTEQGEVLPIELQVVGAQLQSEHITTLSQYRQIGTKETLVERLLESSVIDCGLENERVARSVLFLLTGDSETRPLKTRQDLKTELIELGLSDEIQKLDLVLEIFATSGLIFIVPESPEDCYQLIHGYLVKYIRKQSRELSPSRLEEALKQEREGQKLSDEAFRQLVEECDLE